MVETITFVGVHVGESNQILEVVPFRLRRSFAVPVGRALGFYVNSQPAAGYREPAANSDTVTQ